MGTAERTALAEEIIESLDAINGRHPGHRAVHAKGTFWRGSFTPTAEAASLARAAHLSGGPVPVTGRFSNASGNPRTSDANPLAGRGMAVKFEPSASEPTDIVAVALPVWVVRTPEDFLEFTRSRAPDPETGQPDPERFGAFLGGHPEAARALQLGMPSLAPVRSFACSEFNALHAFALVDADGERTWGRYGWRPAAEADRLTEDEIAEADRDHLQAEIRERLAEGTAAFSLEFTLAAEGDSLEDPTDPWEGERETVKLGELEIESVIEDAEAEGPIVFDPMRLIDGIEPSEDPILAIRPVAYSISVERRAAPG
jgi:catalase